MEKKELKNVVQELVEMYFQTGDKDIAGQIFELLVNYEWSKNKLYRAGAKLGGGVEEGKSLYAETFVKYLDNYKPTAPFVNYINTCVRFAERDNGKKHRTYTNRYYTQDLLDLELSGAKEASAWAQEDGLLTQTAEEQEAMKHRAVVQILENAPENERDILLAYMSCKSYEEAGAAVGVHKSTVQRTVKRAKKYFHGDIEELMDTIDR
jgi:RNA polymerase sigma factor (sigma-70 family)